MIAINATKNIFVISGFFQDKKIVSVADSSISYLNHATQITLLPKKNPGKFRDL